jgi:predicted Zn finger-like uncharacterized protein
MSLITRCPACQTMFRVVPDQLRISDGWVRCGQCEEIFDASLHLLLNQPAEAPIAPRQVDLPELPDELSQPDDTEFLEPTVTPQETADQWPQPLRDSEALEVAEDYAQESEPDELQNSASAVTPDLDVEIGSFSVNEGVPQAVLVEPQVSFLKTENGLSFWGRTSVRWTMGLLGLMLLLGLALQVLVHERNRIVALEPSTKPWMQMLCDALNCTLSPLRGIESIVIESSSFARVRGESHQLSFVLKNTSDMALALPSMELTLTDAQDQVVTRRVFEASELGATGKLLVAGAEWSGAATIAVDTGSKAERVAGYRLLAFYP